jgi:CheY-like chemotaxis protein
MPFAMVIDDDDVSSEIMTHFLERDGYSVWTTLDVDQALQRCRESGLDLVVSDVVLHAPFSGTELSCALRGVCPSVPVLLVSGTPVEGWSDNDLAHLGSLAAGPVEFLMKPFTARTFARKVAKLRTRTSSDNWIRSALDTARKSRKTLDGHAH